MEVRSLDVEGGRPGGIFDNSSIIRRSLESLRDAGGGTFVVPGGIWSTGPIELYSQTTLKLEEGAILSFIPDPELYRPVRTRWEGIECFAMHPCLFSSGQRRVAVIGKGRLDGNGQVWWDMLRAKRSRGQKGPELPIEWELAGRNPGFRSQPGGGGGRELQFLRPPLVQFYNCSEVRLEGVSLSNSPFWTLHPVYCSGVVIKGVHIANPHDAPNTDGIDIDSSCNVEISGCDVSVGDDGIALKSGSGSEGIRVNRPTSHVVIRGCTVRNGHGGIVIGSETAAGIHDVVAENCSFYGTDRGIRIKTRRGRGGEISDLVFKNLSMEGNLCPLAINMYYRCGAGAEEDGLFSLDAQPVGAETPHIRRVSVIGIRAQGCRASAGFVVGLPEAPVEDLVLSDCVFITDEDSCVPPDESDMFFGIPPVDVRSFRLRFVRDPVFEQVTVKGPAKPFVTI